jgi:hypothetical protein
MQALRLGLRVCPPALSGTTKAFILQKTPRGESWTLVSAQLVEPQLIEKVKVVSPLVLERVT